MTICRHRLVFGGMISGSPRAVQATWAVSYPRIALASHMEARAMVVAKFSTEDAAFNQVEPIQETIASEGMGPVMAKRTSECRNGEGSETLSDPQPEARSCSQTPWLTRARLFSLGTIPSTEMIGTNCYPRMCQKIPSSSIAHRVVIGRCSVLLWLTLDQLLTHHLPFVSKRLFLRRSLMSMGYRIRTHRTAQVTPVPRWAPPAPQRAPGFQNWARWPLVQLRIPWKRCLKSTPQSNQYTQSLSETRAPPWAQLSLPVPWTLPPSSPKKPNRKPMWKP
jgi:hypothetical protein